MKRPGECDVVFGVLAAATMDRDLRSGLLLTATMALAFVVVLSRLLAVATGPTAPTTGQPAPGFRAQTVTGETLDLSDLAGKVVVLDFWATWCPPCVASMPHLQQLHEQYAARGVAVVGVNQEPGHEPRVRTFLMQRGISFPSVMDEDGIGVRYGVHSYPTTLVLDRDLNVRATFRGPPPPERLERSILAVLDDPAGG